MNIQRMKDDLKKNIIKDAVDNMFSEGVITEDELDERFKAFFELNRRDTDELIRLKLIAHGQCHEAHKNEQNTSLVFLLRSAAFSVGETEQIFRELQTFALKYIRQHNEVARQTGLGATRNQG